MESEYGLCSRQLAIFKPTNPPGTRRRFFFGTGPRARRSRGGMASEAREQGVRELVAALASVGFRRIGEEKAGAPTKKLGRAEDSRVGEAPGPVCDGEIMKIDLASGRTGLCGAALPGDKSQRRSFYSTNWREPKNWSSIPRFRMAIIFDVPGVCRRLATATRCLMPLDVGATGGARLLRSARLTICVGTVSGSCRGEERLPNQFAFQQPKALPAPGSLRQQTNLTGAHMVPGKLAVHPSKMGESPPLTGIRVHGKTRIGADSMAAECVLFCQLARTGAKTHWRHVGSSSHYGYYCKS